jgi:ribulose-phosphate 3-epimerase
MNHLVAPSLLAADFLNLGRAVEMINKSKADWIHCDVMDGVFVPNISFGFSIIHQVSLQATKPLEVHLMIVDPDKYIKTSRDAGADILSVQYEACTHLHRTVQNIVNNGMKPGVVLNPHTPVEVLTDIIHELYLVLIMSVNPGFGGQNFIFNTYNKIERLRYLIKQRNANTIIQVDGGVDLNNAPRLLKTGANALVAGSSVFQSPDPIAAIEALKNL